METKKLVGSIKSIWQYPVKSMNGVKLDKADFSTGGILGDRAYALLDQSNNKVASAKFPKKWSKLLELSATFVTQPNQSAHHAPVRITSTNGLDILSTDDNADKLLSDYVGRPVKLTSSRPKSVSLERLDPLESNETILDIGDLMLKNKFSDYADLHLLTTASLKQLSSISADINFDERRFRPNIVIETDSSITGFAENEWVGKTIVIGESVRLNITDPTPRCSIPTLSNGVFPKDPEVLKTIVDHNMLEVPLLDNNVLPCTGIYGFLTDSGVVSINDSVWIE
ncbi:MAG: MOSC domain-containing protein [Gammaproteobacteria bacterium]|nr:MOSC domain-containing protein [Gammaproteobacteria bacterium]